MSLRRLSRRTLEACLPLSLCTLAVGFVATHSPRAQAQTVAELRGTKLLPNAIWFQDLDWKRGAQQLSPNRSTKNTPISIDGQVFERGLGGAGTGQLLIKLDGLARRFVAVVGIDDVEKSNGTKRFEVWLDGKKVAETGIIVKGKSELLSVDLTGARDMQLYVLFGGEDSDWDRYDLAGAQLVLEEAAFKSGQKPKPYRPAPPPPPEPTMPIASSIRAEVSINGPLVVGGSPGRPFIYRLPISGDGPFKISVKGLPKGLSVNADGVIAGTLPKARRYKLEIVAKGPHGQARRGLELWVSSETAARSPTPPMGWNAWNAWGMAIDGDKVRAAADSMIKSGLASHGYRYINIDDGWQGTRAPSGEIQSNENFPDMKGLASHVHSLGLRVGIYSSPGPKTCGGVEGSYQHEAQDARTYATWGFDYLKYDWCSYDEIKKDWSLAEQRKPYEVMGTALAALDRDVVFSLCQYGHARVWDWGAEVGGTLWRTTSDISDSWQSVENIGFSQVGKESAAGPGRFNDPDMLIVGNVGWGPKLHPTLLSGNEQILHITHWSMLAAPLLIGADMSDLDAFTLDLLSNDEVIAVDQDPLVKQASRVLTNGQTEVWARKLYDGTTAVALYNRGPKSTRVTAGWKDLGIKGSQPVRDLWQRKDLGNLHETLAFDVPQHGAILLKIGKPRRPAN